MSEFYVTFGCQYAHEQHPRLGAAHPDGWLTIEADDEVAARATAIAWLGTAWSFMYDEKPDLRLFPLGELHRVASS